MDLRLSQGIARVFFASLSKNDVGLPLVSVSSKERPQPQSATQRHKSNRYVFPPMQQALIEKLEAFGLSAKEAHLYALLLKYGPKTTGELAKLLHSNGS